MKKIFIIIASCMLCLSVFAEESASADSTQNVKKAVRKGWSLAPLPCIAYDQDMGFQFGALANLYYFGSGDIYPEYYHSFFAQAAYYTKGMGQFRIMYDSKHLIKNHRLTIDVTYLPETQSDFFGFNGSESQLHPEWADKEDGEYIIWDYYKMKRNLFRFAADLQGNISGNLFWNAGVGLLDYRVASRESDSLTLYDKYVVWGLIRDNEKKGGAHPYIHGGLTFDTRDRLQNPTHGIHTDLFLTYYAAFGDMKEYNHLKLNFNFRNYIPIWRDRITFAYQLGTQLTLAGETPYYLNTHLNQLYLHRVIYEGLGGGNSVRGMLRNRILADGFVYANVELRLKLFSFHIGKELFYVGINPFLDYGQIAQRHLVKDAQLTGLDVEHNLDFTEENDIAPWQKPHFTAGCGVKVVMNDNFALSVDWARPFDSQDNSKPNSFYLKIGYMF